MHFKNHSISGFGLVEALIAVVIIGTLLSALLALQSTVFQQTVKMYRRVNNIFLVKKMLAEHIYFAQKVPEKKSKTIAEPLPSTQLMYEGKGVGGQGRFEKFDNLYRIKVVGKWKDLVGPHEQSMVGFVFEPEQKKKK